MGLKIIDAFKPDSYLPTVYDINYPKLYENGIKYAVFDVDCTLLPFDDTRVTSNNESLFKNIADLGMNAALCSSGSEKRVKPVADILKVNYMARARKPFVAFADIKKMFDDDCEPNNTMFVGDSLYLDMLLADRNKMYKVLVDMVRDGANLKLFTNDVIQAVMYTALKTEGFHFKEYYIGYRER